MSLSAQRKKFLQILVIMIAATITVAALARFYREREMYKALRKPTGNNTKEFLAEVAKFKEEVAEFEKRKSEGIVRAVTDSDGNVSYIDDSPFFGMDFTNMRLGPEELGYLKGLNNVGALCFRRTTIKDSDMELISQIPGLVVLVLDETRIGDEGIKYLKDHPSLAHLYVNKTRISDKGLETLVTIPNLCDLHIWRGNITDEGCKSLAKIKNLYQLSLDGTMVTDVGVKRLFPLKNLQVLKCGGAKTTKEGRDAVRRNWPNIHLNSEFGND